MYVQMMTINLVETLLEKISPKKRSNISRKKVVKCTKKEEKNLEKNGKIKIFSKW